jgi:hypothetical protein
MKALVNTFVIVCLVIACHLTLFAHVPPKEASPVFFQLKIYHLKTASQKERLNSFLQTACVPALHRAGIKEVGVFKPVTPDSLEELVYVLIPFKSLEQFAGIETVLQQDKEFQEKGKDYLNASYAEPPYSRIESILLKAFSGMPVPKAPDLSAEKSKRIYELRSYESATEKYYVNKVQMFNQGDEIGLFKRLGFNAIFYAEVLSGTHMPNLMYMTSFNSKQDRDEHWQTFRNDPEWKKLSSLPEYQKNVSKADITFLYPADYSDF